MNLNRRAIFLMVCILLCISQQATSQDSSSVYFKALHFPDKLFKKVNGKSQGINEKLMAKTGKYLERLAREERRLQNKLAGKDSLAALKIFGDVQAQYAVLQSKVKSTSATASTLRSKYIPHLDTLKTAFSFLENSNGLLKSGVQSQAQLKEAMGKMDVLQQKFNQAEEVKKYIQQRRQFLKEQLGKYGMAKDLKKLQKQVYYYQAQVDEYKRMFDDPSKIESKTIVLLKQSAVFNDFFKKHSQLAGLFRMPESTNGDPTAALAGLQTRASIQQDLLQRFGTAPNVQQMMQQQLQGAQSELGKLKDRLNALKSGSKSNGDPSMPDFRPNGQKTKSFKNRLELGSNLQTVKANYFFPSTTDIGLSVGYKLNDKSVIGIGSSYKIGWGKDIRHINITHQGVGLRTFMDYKIKGSFWLSGGVEANYRSQFNSFEVLNNYSAWQRSALIGFSKKYQVGKKLKGNAQLLYDFLWKEQVPKTQPIVFRVGYSL